jgi:hypothetical protein
MTLPSNPSPWKRHYQSALDESSQVKLQEKVHIAELAIFVRWQELAGDSDHHQERNDLSEACENLLRVKTRRLGWPELAFEG